jgi:hypothetical protein
MLESKHLGERQLIIPSQQTLAFSLNSLKPRRKWGWRAKIRGEEKKIWKILS